MIFSSLTFLCVFLPIVFLLHCAVPGMRAKNFLLIVASLFFYAYGEPIYVFLMLGSTVLTYTFGRLLGSSRVRHHRAVLVVSIIVSLGTLGVFKYADMFVGTLDALLGLALPLPEILLPIGLSFFIFQSMSYLIDVYRGTVEGQKNYANVLLYISFFPQLMAGPIVKYHDIEDQLKQRIVNAPEVSQGIRRFVVGLAKKVLIANTFATTTDAIFSAPSNELNMVVAWIGALAYLLQIYFDFSGYSDMAIGLAHMFGFTFKENFNYPYTSRSIKEFWRRWHISLSTWFKEYLYIPLGGNRKGRMRTSLNKMIVFFCTGLWHGANWTFVIWGLFHGFFLLLEDFLPLKRLPRFLGHIYALLVVTVGFVIFRAETLDQGLLIIGNMFVGWSLTPVSMSLAVEQLTPLFIVTTVIAMVAAFPIKDVLIGWVKERGILEGATTFSYAGSVFLLLLCILSLSSGSYNPFIYFRF